LKVTEERDDPAVTVSIIFQVRPGREPDFERFLRGISDAVSEFPGFVGVRVFRPTRGQSQYRIVLRFDRESNLRRWQESEERRIWYARGEELAEEAPTVEDITGTSQARPLALALTPLQEFVRTSVSGIGLLLAGAVVALVLANSPLSEGYTRFWNTDLTIGVPGFAITEPLRRWVNDALMAIFFFLLGLEIKREVLVGELRSPRRAAFPIAAALGGAIVPALLFLVLNLGGVGVRGWGIPIGTDTAFALGILSLLGSRVRPVLVVFLTAETIVDDIIAVLVIAIFYTDTISWPALGIAAVLMVLLGVANYAGINHLGVYAVLGLGVWLAIFESGVHGTIAGVLVAMMIPARSWINPSAFLKRSRQLLDEFERSCFIGPSILTNEPQQRVTQTLEQLCEQVETPMTRLEHRLNPWVAFGILPVFALANAGIPVLSGLGEALTNPVTWGVIAGLVVGKPVGIALFSWLAVRVGVAVRPRAIEWSHVAALGFLSGIGFTMSLFITELSFEAGPIADAARVGILLASLVAGAVGYLVLRATLPPPRDAAGLATPGLTDAEPDEDLDDDEEEQIVQEEPEMHAPAPRMLDIPPAAASPSPRLRAARWWYTTFP
jgi:NhaA family Na+:H+ antiporter